MYVIYESHHHILILKHHNTTQLGQGGQGGQGDQRYNSEYGRKTLKPVVFPPVGRGLGLKAQVTMRHKIEDLKEVAVKKPTFFKC